MRERIEEEVAKERDCFKGEGEKMGGGKELHSRRGTKAGQESSSSWKE